MNCSLGKTCLQDWPPAGLCALGFQEGSHYLPHTGGYLTMPKPFAQCGLCWAATSFWKPGILLHTRQKVPIWPAPPHNLGHSVSGELALLATLHMHHNSLPQELGTSCVTPLGKDSCAWFPPDFTPWTFAFADLALYAFPIINLSHEYNYTLNPGNPWHKRQICISLIFSVPGPGEALYTDFTMHSSPQVSVAGKPS